MEDSQSRRNHVLDGFQLNNNGPSGAAGYTYLGQLLSHDLRLDEESVLGIEVDPTLLPNTNTPYLDLDTLYEFNGVSSGVSDNGKFDLEDVGSFTDRDFPRDPLTGEALIADPRNDEHRIVSQLATAFMALHNKLYDELGESTRSKKSNKQHDKRRFKKAKKETIRTW